MLNSNEHVEQAKRALMAVRHFAELPEHVQSAVAESAVLHTCGAGKVIYLEGEPGEALYILEAGWVRATRMSLDGREQAMLFLRPGEVFGDIAVFTGVPYPGTVTALEPVRAWSISRSRALKLISRYPELALAVIKRLGERILYYVGLVEDLSLRSVEARLACTLLQNAVHDGEELVVPRHTWTTYDEMAVRLGTVRDVLGRALHTLEQEGLLRIERRRFVILDASRLAERGNSL